MLLWSQADLKGGPKKMFSKTFFSFFTILFTLQVTLHFRISSCSPSWWSGCLSSWSLPLASLVWSWWDPYTECCCWRFGAKMLWFQLSGFGYSWGLNHLNPAWLWPRYSQLAIRLPSLAPEAHGGSYDWNSSEWHQVPLALYEFLHLTKKHSAPYVARPCFTKNR